MSFFGDNIELEKVIEHIKLLQAENFQLHSRITELEDKISNYIDSSEVSSSEIFVKKQDEHFKV